MKVWRRRYNLFFSKIILNYQDIETIFHKNNKWALLLLRCSWRRTRTRRWSTRPASTTTCSTWLPSTTSSSPTLTRWLFLIWTSSSGGFQNESPSWLWKWLLLLHIENWKICFFNEGDDDDRWSDVDRFEQNLGRSCINIFKKNCIFIMNIKYS